MWHRDCLCVSVDWSYRYRDSRRMARVTQAWFPKKSANDFK